MTATCLLSLVNITAPLSVNKSDCATPPHAQQLQVQDPHLVAGSLQSSLGATEYSRLYVAQFSHPKTKPVPLNNYRGSHHVKGNPGPAGD